MEGLKRSSSAERQSEFNKDLENHRYGDNSYHRRHEMPPPWERGGLYSDRHRMPQRDPEPHQEYTNRPYRQPQREHPTPYGGHVTQQYGHPMERPRYERRRNSLEAEVGFEFDVSGGRMYKERQEFNNSQFDNRAMNRDRIVTMEDVKYLNEYDGQPRLEPNKPRTLEKEDVFLKLIPLGDTRERLAQSIVDACSFIARNIYQPVLDAEEFKEISNDYRLPNKSDCSSHRRAVEHNMAVISTSICECATYLPTKSGIYASVVAEFGVCLIRLPEGIAMADVEAAPEIKADPSDELAIDRKTKVDEFRLKRVLLCCLVRTIIAEVVNQLDEHLGSGRVSESKNLLRFIMELTNCHLIQPADSFDLMTGLIKISQQASSADHRDSLYAEQLICIVIGALPWLTRSSCESQPEKFTECFTLLNEVLSYRQLPLIANQSLSGLWGSGVRLEDSLSLAQTGLKSFKDSWSSKILWRLYQTGSLAESFANHEAVVQHTLPPLSFSFQKLSESLEKNRTIGSQISLGAGVGTEFQLIASGGLGGDSASYGSAAAEFGVGGGSLGLNACWRPRACIIIWDDSALAQLLLGVRPLEVHDRWLLEELFLSVLHCFRHTPELCAEVLLRIPVSHDQFEAILVEVIFNEILRLPHSAEPLIFYFRLFDFICQKQRTVYNLVGSAFVSLSHRVNLWDNQTTESLAEFLGLWLSILPEGPQSFGAFDFWSPEALRRDAHQWQDLSHEFIGSSDAVVSLLDRSSQIMHQRLPNSLKLFISRAMDRLSRILWHGNFASKLPPWLHAYVPEDSQFRCSFARRYDKMIKTEMDDESKMVEAATEEPSDPEDDERFPFEYALFRKLIQVRFASSEHQQLSVLQFAQILFYKLLGKPALAQMPSNGYINRIVCPITLQDPDQDNQMTDNENFERPTHLDLMEVDPDCNEAQLMSYISTVKDETVGADETDVGGVEKIDVKKDDVEKIDVKKDDDVERVDVVNVDDEMADAVILKSQDDNKIDITAENMDSEQRNLHERALSRTMAEHFVHQETPGGWSLCNLAEHLMRALLGVGAKTLTHSSRVLENYQQLLKWMRPSGQRNELNIPKDIEEAVNTTNADSEYYAALLRSVFSIWRDGPVKCQFTVDKLASLNIIPVEEIQMFILKRLSLNRIGDLSTQAILFHLVREAIRQLLMEEEELKLLKRTIRFENEEEKKLSVLHESTSRSRCQLGALVINNLVETCRRLTQLSVSEVGGFPTADLIDDDGGVAESNEEVEIVGRMSRHQEFLERQSIRRLLHYGRTFVQFLDIETVQEQVNQTNPKAEICETLKALKSIQLFLYPHGIAEDFLRFKKDTPKDEIE